MKNLFRKRTPTPQEVFIRSFLDCIAPGVVKFEVDHYIFGLSLIHIYSAVQIHWNGWVPHLSSIAAPPWGTIS